jgi:23S rRNA pseudouridine955/2504/2580 synthase/23S rRNA pseudouridine1911/1915/1917 synthase
MHNPAAPTIITENDSLVVVNKPSGLLSIPDRFDANLPSVKSMLKERYGNIFVVHRIDRDTSGIILFAKTAGLWAEAAVLVLLCFILLF